MEQMRERVELLPCPFCGGAADVHWHTKWFNSGSQCRGYSVSCEQCDLLFGTDNRLTGSHKDHTEGAFSTDESAIAAWNTRAALSLMQPEIDRRVAEEKARLLERLRVPSEAMIDAGCEEIAYVCDTDYVEPVWQAMLAQFEKEQDDG